MKRLLIIIAAAALLTPCTTAGAWGRKGHETIAKIAERNLTPAARGRIESYFGGHTIVYYAKWMDEYRHTPEYKFTSDWHVVPVDSDNLYAANPKGDAIYGIEQAVEQLRDYKALSDSAVCVNLKYLIHLVGDMHCPAHIKYANHEMKYDVTLPDIYGHKQKYYVHHVWDNAIIDQTRIWSVTEWAEELDRCCTAEQKAAIAAGTPREWLHNAAVICEKQFEIAKPDQHLGQDFLNEALPIVETEIRNAGLRLAALLNELFD